MRGTIQLTLIFAAVILGVLLGRAGLTAGLAPVALALAPVLFVRRTRLLMVCLFNYDIFSVIDAAAAAPKPFGVTKALMPANLLTAGIIYLDFQY
ncbi:MAG: hypothetical protein NVSMB39_2190 [Candidatus Saccharimonadales bacterium]